MPLEIIEIKPKDIIEKFETCIRQNESPLGGIMNIGLFKLCEKAKKDKIKVILGGYGLDEALGGYDILNPNNFSNRADKTNRLIDGTVLDNSKMILNHLNSSEFNQLESDLKSFLDTYDTKIKNIILINNVPEIPNIIYQNIKRQILFQSYENINFDYDKYNSYNFKFDNILNKSLANKNYKLIDVTDALCENFGNNKKCYAQKNYEPYYFDTNHLSNEGSEQLSRIIINNFKN